MQEFHLPSRNHLVRVDARLAPEHVEQGDLVPFAVVASGS